MNSISYDALYDKLNSMNFNKEPLDTRPLVKLTPEVHKSYVDWLRSQRLGDEWVNPVANANVGNSLLQHTRFTSTRLQYHQCSLLSKDTIINKAINTLAKDIIGNQGYFTITTPTFLSTGDILTKLDSELTKLHFWQSLRDLIEKALTFGGAFLFLDNHDNLSNEANFTPDYFHAKPIQSLRVLSPHLLSPREVEFMNPLHPNYMRPMYWDILSVGKIHHTRLCELTLFNVTEIEKPLYNFLGISLPEFMQSYVKSVEVLRSSITEIALRFKTTIIQSEKHDLETDEMYNRIKSINAQQHNFSTLFLENNDKFIQSITPLTGLDSILSLAYQNLAISARMPAVKLLGLSPQGLNNTGEFDMNNYYDEIESYQKSIIVHVVNRVAQAVLWGLGYDMQISFQFIPIAQESNLQKAQRESIVIDNIDKLLASGVITPEQAFDRLKIDKIIPSSYEFQAGESID